MIEETDKDVSVADGDGDILSETRDAFTEPGEFTYVIYEK